MSLSRPGLVDRESEKQSLLRLADREGPRLALLYGRRRVGKTFLLDRTWENGNVFYFLAADSTSAMNRMDLVRDLGAWSERDLDPDEYPTWRTVFRLFAELARQGPLVVILDEFQYLLGGDDDAASQLVAVWDREVRALPLTLILCGSEVSMMERLQGADQPLYGRLDWSHWLRPFDYFDAGMMVLDRGSREAAQVYGVFGGTPQCLASIEEGESLADAVCRTMLAPGGPVRMQLENIIEQEKGIRIPAEYRAVLAAVARGRSRRNEIATTSGLAGRPGVARRILERLEDLGLIWREQNFESAANAPYRYRVCDNALRFWYRFVDPNRSALETGNLREVWDSRIEPQLGTYMGRVFETICREGFERWHRQWGLAGAIEWARWEGQDRNRRSIEIDIAARLLDGQLLTGEVKWSSSLVGLPIHTQHLRKLEALAVSGQGWARDALADVESALYVYFSAAGFEDELLRLAGGDERVFLFDLGDLYPSEARERRHGSPRGRHDQAGLA